VLVEGNRSNQHQIHNNYIFYIYIYISIVKNESTIKTVLYADDQLLVAKSEDELQMAAHRLSNIAKKYNLKISTSKTKSMGMCGNEIRRLKIMIDGKIMEDVTEFNYTGSKISE
jgi:hypothetical protein